VADVDERKAENVAKEGTVGFRVLGIEQDV
jgi:hypothetical protein